MRKRSMRRRAAPGVLAAALIVVALALALAPAAGRPWGAARAQEPTVTATPGVVHTPVTPTPTPTPTASPTTAVPTATPTASPVAAPTTAAPTATPGVVHTPVIPAAAAAAPAPAAAALTAAGGTVVAPGAGIAILLPPGAVAAPVIVTITPVSAPSAAPLEEQPRLQAILHALGVPVPPSTSGAAALVLGLFRVDVTDAATGVPAGPLAQPATLSVDVGAPALAAAGGDLAAVSVRSFDAATGTWTPAPCAATTTGLDCRVTHFSLWAVVARGVLAAGVPPAPAPGGGVQPAPASAGGGALAAVIGGARREGLRDRAVPWALALMVIGVAGLLAVVELPRLRARRTGPPDERRIFPDS